MNGSPGRKSLLAAGRRRSSLLLLAALLVGWFLSGRAPSVCVAPAAACSCANSMPPMLQPYGRDVPRPRNARLRFEPVWALPSYGEWATANGFDGKRWDLTLKKQGSATPIAFEQRTVGDTEERTLEVWPKDPLEKGATYEIARTGSDGGAGGGSWPTLHATFTTTAVVDTVAPTWPGVRGARYLPTGLPPDTSCSVSDPLIELDLSPATDDATAADEIVFAVWSGDSLDYGAAPRAIVHSFKGFTYLGRAGYCGEADFRVNPAAPAHLGVRALDLAGNASAPSEIIVPTAGERATVTPGTPSSAASVTVSPDATVAPRTRCGCSL